MRLKRPPRRQRRRTCGAPCTRHRWRKRKRGRAGGRESGGTEGKRGSGKRQRRRGGKGGKRKAEGEWRRTMHEYGLAQRPPRTDANERFRGELVRATKRRGTLPDCEYKCVYTYTHICTHWIGRSYIRTIYWPARSFYVS